MVRKAQSGRRPVTRMLPYGAAVLVLLLLPAAAIWLPDLLFRLPVPDPVRAEGVPPHLAAEDDGRLFGRIVFVLDLSSSMRITDQVDPRGEKHPPISRLEAAGHEVMETLIGLSERGSYEFDMVLFAGSLHVLSRDHLGKEGLLPLDGRHVEEARAFLAQVREGGSTRLLPALKIGFDLLDRAPIQGVLSSLFLYTDGVPTFGPDDDEDPQRFSDFLTRFRQRVRDENPGNVKISTYAVGATSISRDFLQALAADHGGITIFVSPAPMKDQDPKKAGTD